MTTKLKMVFSTAVDINIGYNMHTSFFFCIPLLSVLHGHSFLSSPPQRPMTSDFEVVFFIYENSYNVHANVIACIILGDTISWSLFVLPSLIRSLNSHLICTLNFSMKFNQWVINSCKIILKLNNIFSKKVWLQLFHSFKLYFLFWKFRIFH